jgi:hypothetical protein
MRYGPPLAYAHRRDGRRLAYQVVGTGDLSTPEEREEVFVAIRTLPPSDLGDRLLAALAPREAADPSVRQWWRMFSASASSPVETLEGIRALGPVLVAGSGFAFAERGTHRLKGVPDSWQLYAVELAER